MGFLRQALVWIVSSCWTGSLLRGSGLSRAVIARLAKHHHVGQIVGSSRAGESSGARQAVSVSSDGVVIRVEASWAWVGIRSRGWRWAVVADWAEDSRVVSCLSGEWTNH